MKIKGTLTIKSEDANELVNIITQSLAPDNLSRMTTSSNETSATITFSAEKMGTMLSSVDDYLMNAKIACDMIEKIRKQ